MQSVKLSVTVRGNLERKYDAAALKKIDAALKSWIAADAARGFKTVHVAVDDVAAMRALKVPPLKGRATATKVKHAIDALWDKLTPDYLVLFGADDVVPYFVVHNPSHDPSGDDDESVPTDNPYASKEQFRKSRRSSYLIPERVIGRIPDMPNDGDPAWFLDYLATAASWVSERKTSYAGAYAICCDTWKGAGKECIEYIGETSSRLMISPPELDSSPTPKSRLRSRLHMIKCHGSQLDPRFFGQKGKWYPPAVSSSTLKSRMKRRTLVAAMCCYGAQVYSPADPAATLPGEWPLASTYLRKGALGFAGSTMIAWVGQSEMMAADWIVAGYLKGVLAGASLGRALLESKQDFVRWINQQGSAPDLADEKTLIEYVLLGDPSIHPVTVARAGPASKALLASARALPASSALAVQERRQRRVVRARMGEQIRELLPVRLPAKGAARARAGKLFPVVKKILRDDPKAFRMRPKAARVHKLETKLDGARAVARPGAARSAAAPPRQRQSFEYYWSGRRMQDGHKEIRMVRLETDDKGRVLRGSVVQSS